MPRKSYLKSDKLKADLIRGFQSIPLHKTTLGGQLYTYCHFVPCGSEQILFNCIYVLPNTSLIPITHNWIDLDKTTRCLRRRENSVEMASYFNIWMSPGHFHVVLAVMLSKSI